MRPDGRLGQCLQASKKALYLIYNKNERPQKSLGQNRQQLKQEQLILLTTNFTIMRMEKEMKYEAPVVEVLLAEVEQGFISSGTDKEDTDW